jgi:hypothetical protein
LYLVANVVVCFLAVMSAGTILVQQLWFIAFNNTNIELWSRHWSNMRAEELEIFYRYPYDKGVLNNYKEYFGEHPLSWLVPSVVKPSQTPEPTEYPYLCPELDV